MEQLHNAGDALDSMIPDVHPDTHTEVELIEDSIRGPKGARVWVQNADLDVLRRNKLIADGETAQHKTEGTKPAKAEKPAKAKAQAKANDPADNQQSGGEPLPLGPQLSSGPDVPADVPNLADLPGGA